MTCCLKSVPRVSTAGESADPASIVMPRRGDVWLADLNPTQGHEQAGRRPILVISANTYNAGNAGLIVALLLTSKTRALMDRVPMQPPEGGLKVASDVLCGHIRTISHGRLLRRWGNVAPATLGTIETILRLLLQL